MSESNSVTRWLRQLAQGDSAAAEQLWNRYGRELERLARYRYGNLLSAAHGAEDLAQSVFIVLWGGAIRGKWDAVQDRDQLWWLLLAIARRKILKRAARQTAQQDGKGPAVSIDTAGDNSTVALPPSPAISPEDVVILNEEHERLMSLLRNDQLRQIAGWKLEGFSHEEIAVRLNLSTRTIIRKLNLIREEWAKELPA